MKPLAAIVFVLLIFSLSARAAMPPQTGEKAPDWILTTGAGDRISLYADSEDEKVVLIFWATWCPYCRDLMPKLEQLRATLAGKPVRFYALNVWEDADPQAYLANRGLHLKLLLQAEPVAQRYGVVGTPGLFVMDEEKNILYIRQRGTSNDQVIEAIKTALQF
ncbi:TlpA disulfide reductase family protein [Halioxenophilus sp. WMMB6]|uniref:TlpA family protein disulfide reductase n=1 Tax=Halioxenophilus sp. WMMB6 TaxID=3073815 RepID=UPI00295ED9A2|nr:TlpA disulfide reductase family protein [Halioxenophilus sp. WMMB6]